MKVLTSLLVPLSLLTLMILGQSPAPPKVDMSEVQKSLEKMFSGASGSILKNTPGAKPPARGTASASPDQGGGGCCNVTLFSPMPWSHLPPSSGATQSPHVVPQAPVMAAAIPLSSPPQQPPAATIVPVTYVPPATGGSSKKSPVASFAGSVPGANDPAAALRSVILVPVGSKAP